MKFFFLTIFLLTSCQDYNSNSSDRDRYGAIELNETDPNFPQAYAIIQTRCASCHDHAHWAAFKSNADWIGNNYIIPKSPDSSTLINYIINAGGSMPLGGSPLPDAEYNHLLKWVDEIE